MGVSFGGLGGGVRGKTLWSNASRFSSGCMDGEICENNSQEKRLP